MQTPFIDVRHVAKSYGQQNVLRDVTFTLNRGDIIGLLGPNGSGKTTIVRLLNGVIRPDQGTISVDGYDPVKDGDAIRRLSGVVTEGAGLYHDRSGLDNLLFFAEIYDCLNDLRIRELLDLFDLTEHQHKRVGTYSTGMKKRLALAKALLHRPSLLFLDEPTNGLDPEGIQMVMRYLKQLNQQFGTTIFLCSHVLHQMEDVCDTYMFLENGSMIEQGTLKELENKYVNRISLRIETGLQLQGGVFAGFTAKRVSAEHILFELPSKEEIPVLLRKLLLETWVHSAEIVNRDLESIYFQVRREQR